MIEDEKEDEIKISFKTIEIEKEVEHHEPTTVCPDCEKEFTSTEKWIKHDCEGSDDE